MSGKKKRASVNRKSTIIPVKRQKVKKDKILIEVAKNDQNRDTINGLKVMKYVKRYGKYYAMLEKRKI